MRLSVFIAAGLIAGPLAASGQGAESGPEAAAVRSLAVPAAAHSLAPGLTSLPDGGVVLTWLEKTDSGHALKFSRFEDGRFGQAQEIARGGDWFANWADTPALYVLPNGDWVAHWLEKSGPATFAYDIRLVRSTDAGRSWSDPVTPHLDETRTEHGFVSYYSFSSDSVGLFWLDGRQTAGAEGHDADHHGHAGEMTLRTAVLGPNGRVGAKSLLDERVCDCCQTAAGMTRDGPVVVYRDRATDEVRDISIVRWRNGEWSEPELIHADGWKISGCPVNGPDLIARDDELVVAWFTMPDGVPRVRLARSEDAGASFSGIRDFATGDALGRVALGWYEDGYVLLWMEQAQAGARLQLAYFEQGTEPLWRRELSEVDSGRISGFPRLARGGSGRVLVAWTASEEGSPRVRVAEVPLESDVSH